MTQNTAELASFSRLCRTWRAYWVIAVLALASAAVGVTSVPLMDADEARFAQASRQMVESGDYVNIRLQDRERNRKPVGIHWLQAASVHIFAPLTERTNEVWPYRAPSILGFLLAALSTLWIGRALMDGRAAFIGAALFSVGVLAAFEGMTARTDSVLLGVTTLAMGALAHMRLAFGDRWRERRLALLFWAAAGAGALIKGPVTLLVAVVTLLTLAIWERRAAWMHALLWWPGPLLALLIVAPWAISIGLSTDGRFYTNLLTNEIGPKVVGGEHRHGGVLGYYVLLLPILTFPAAYALPAAVRASVERKQFEYAPRESLRFLIAWAVSTIVLFEIFPAKLVHYVMPAFPAIALLCGLGTWLGASAGWRRLHIGGVALFSITGVVLVAALVVGLRELDALDALRMGLVAALGLSLVLGAAIVARSRRVWLRAGALLACGLVLSIAVRGVLVPSLPALRVSERTAAAVFATYPDALDGPRPIWIVGYDEPSLVFHARTSVRLVAPQDLTGVRSGDILIVEEEAQAAVDAQLSALGLRFLNGAESVAGLSLSDSEDVTLRIGEAQALNDELHADAQADEALSSGDRGMR